MTSNDKQIDLLMRRYAQGSRPAGPMGHLDADELSAFAEGSLPAVTRARFISHLADCDECRKQASALAISSGAVARTEPKAAEAGEGRTFWQLLIGLFALPVLRYAAFGAFLLIVAGVAFLALRRPPADEQFVAADQPLAQRRESAVKPPTSVQDGSIENKRGSTANTSTRPLSSPQETTVAGNSKAAEPRAAEGLSVAPPPAMKEVPASAPVTTEKKSGQVDIAQALPSYAPPPPGERASQQKQQDFQVQQSNSRVSGPRQQPKTDSLGKLADAERERDAAKDTGRTDDAVRKEKPQSVASNQPSYGRATDEKLKGPMRNMDNNANNRANDSANRAEQPKALSGGADKREANEEAPQTRSAGGRKFRRQGNAWVDQKFKSSMTLKSVSRSSDEFAGLDSGLRSIAQQLGGEVIVVWKGKAYVIR